MKKVIYLVILILGLLAFAESSYARRAWCFYYQESWSYQTCEKFCEIAQNLGIPCDAWPIGWLEIETQYFQPDDIVYITTHGTKQGFSVDPRTIKPWDIIASIEADLLFVDTCYAGFLFDHNPRARQVITSSGKCYTFAKTFVLTLECWLFPDKCILKTRRECVGWARHFARCQMLINASTGAVWTIPLEQGVQICIGTATIKNEQGGLEAWRGW